MCKRRFLCFSFYGIEQPKLLQCIFSSWLVIGKCLIKLTACMRHTMQYGYIFTFFKEVVYRITIGLKMSFKIFQHYSWSFSASSHLIIEECQPFNTVVVYPKISTVRFTFLILVQYFNRAFINM